MSKGESKKKIVPKNPKRITTSNIDKNNKLSKENNRIIKFFSSMKD